MFWTFRKTRTNGNFHSLRKRKVGALSIYITQWDIKNDRTKGLEKVKTPSLLKLVIVIMQV